MEIVNYLRILRRRWQLVLALGVVGLAIGFATSLIGGPANEAVLYRGTHTLISSDNSAPLQQLKGLTTQGEVPKRVAEKLGGQPVALAAQVTVDARPELGMLQINGVAADPRRAEQIADTFATELVAFQGELDIRKRDSNIANLQKERDRLSAEYDQVLKDGAADPSRQEFYLEKRDELLKQDEQVETQIDQIRKAPVKGALTTSSTAEAVPISGAAVAQMLQNSVTSSKAGSSSTSSDDQLNAALGNGPGLSTTSRAGLGTALGLVLGAALALVIERLDPRIRTKEDAEEIFGLPVIAETPPLTRRQQRETAVLAWDQPRSRAAEAYRVLRSAVVFAAQADGSPLPTDRGEIDERPAGAKPTRAETRRSARVLMVSSASPSEGKTTTTANLAAVLGESGLEVLVVNCDFRRPKVHAFLGTDSDPLEIVATEIDGVSLLSRVTPDSLHSNPAEVVAAQRKVVRDHLRDYDVIILDTAPLLTTNDAIEVLPVADQVILVARAGRTTKEAADRTAELLERRGAPVTGVCLVGATDGPGGRYYYYGAGKSYYLDDSAQRRPRGRADDEAPDDEADDAPKAKAATKAKAETKAEATSSSSRDDANGTPGESETPDGTETPDGSETADTTATRETTEVTAGSTTSAESKDTDGTDTDDTDGDAPDEIEDEQAPVGSGSSPLTALQKSRRSRRSS